MQTVVAEILAAWRRIERLTEGLEEGSEQHAAAVRASEHLRAAYHELTQSGAAHTLSPREARSIIADLDPGPDLA
jgi:hypothetical protein